MVHWWFANVLATEGARLNLASIIDNHPDDQVAIISRGEPTTYGELRDQVARLRGGFVGLGIEPGDRVAIVASNNWYFVVAYLAAVGVGAVAVPLNPSSPAAEIEIELSTISARAVVLGPTGARAFRACDRAAIPTVEFVVEAAASESSDVVAFDELMAAAPVDVLDRADDDLAVMMFTSGTAGRPKAAMLSHRNLLSNIEQQHSLPTRTQNPDDVVFGVLTLFHIFGLNVVLAGSLATGSTVLLVERFDPQSSIDAIRKHGVTVISGAPTMYAAWAALPGVTHADFATVRRAASGASKLHLETAEAVEARLGFELVEGYGLTEASPVVTTGVGVPAPRGSIGVPLSGLSIRLVDADGQDALIGDPGELWVKGPNVFMGYWENPEATANCLTADGWLRTGDIAVVDDDGFIFLVDRAKDLIIVSGFNVYPAEVEDVIIEHPGVEAVAVVGVEHPYSGEAVKAYVVPSGTPAVEEDDIIEFCETRLARYKCPGKVLFVDELPQGLGGKVLKRELRIV